MSFINVNKNHPCPICKKTNWCFTSNNGSYVGCRRVCGEQSITRLDKNGTVYYLYLMNYKLERIEGGKYPITVKLIQEALSSECLHTVYSALLSMLALGDSHYADLIKRGLTKQEIRCREYRTLPLRGRSRIARNLFEQFDESVCRAIPGLYLKTGDMNKNYWSIAGPPGLLIPIRNLDKQIIALKIRTYDDSMDSKYFYLSSLKKGGVSPGTPIHVPIFYEHLADVIRITEGELKADVATFKSGILTLSIPGVSIWKLVIPIIEQIKNIKTILLAFDSDAKTNWIVASSLKNLAIELNNLNYQVEMETWAS